MPTERSPRHTGLFHPLCHQRLARGFDDAAPNRQSLTQIVGIVHVEALIPKVGEFMLHALALGAAHTAALIFEDAHHLVSTLIRFFQQRFQSFKFSFATRGAFTPRGITSVFQMLTR